MVLNVMIDRPGTPLFLRDAFVFGCNHFQPAVVERIRRQFGGTSVVGVAVGRGVDEGDFGLAVAHHFDDFPHVFGRVAEKSVRHLQVFAKARPHDLARPLGFFVAFFDATARPEFAFG